MEWRIIYGYKFLYRISEEGKVEKQDPRTGKWVAIQAYLNNKRSVVHIHVTDTYRRPIAVHSLMDQCFFNGYAKKNGLCIMHKNGALMDCGKENLMFLTRRQCALRSSKIARAKRVVKVDKYGNEIEFYKSCKEAAQKNHLSETAIYHRVNNKLKHPFLLDGYNYQFVE